MPPPLRHSWAVELLDAGPDDELLEIGCGTGVATDLVCRRLERAGGAGRLMAIDRSATAIAGARRRNAPHLAAGRLLLMATDLLGLDVTPGRFAGAFAVNVNVFWTTSAVAECAALRAVVAPEGSVFLVYSGPGDTAPEVTDRIVANLTRHGFTADVRPGPEPSLLCVTGRPS